MKKSFTTKGKVWRWPGDFGWHFVYVDHKLNEEIKKKGTRYGSGFVRIRATLGKTSWDTALFPHKKEDAYLISVKKDIRKKEGITEGDLVEIKFRLS